MKRIKIKKLIAVVVFSIVSCFGVLGVAYADSNTMTVSPPYQKMILVPGEEYKGSINVFNASGSTRDLKFSVEVGSFSQNRGDSNDAKDDYAAMDHISRSNYNQIMDWIKLGKKSGTLAPGESEDIVYTIDVPEDAPGGGQYATILVIDETTSGPAGDGNVSIDQKFQFASIIYAEVAGNTKEEGAIKNNSIPSFLFSGPLMAESLVRNNGNVHTDAEYTLQVWPQFSDEEICTNEEKPETSLVLPETERYHTQSCDLPSIGIFRAKQTVKIFGEELTVERMIIVCPLWLLFVIIFVVVLIIVWIFVKVRNAGRRKSSKAKDEE